MGSSSFSNCEPYLLYVGERLRVREAPCALHVCRYMVTNETLFHKNPVTGEKQVIGLGWLDDSMSLAGPSEEDKNYIADTGSSPASMMAQTAAYRESMYQLVKKVVPM